MLMPSASLADGVELEHVHVGLGGEGQPGHLLAAPLLVDLQELVDLGGHGVGGLGGTADRTDPVPEFLVLDPSGLAQVHQFDPLAPQVAHLLVPDLESLAAPVVFAEPPRTVTGIEKRRFSSSVIRLSWARSRSVMGRASMGTPPVCP